MGARELILKETWGGGAERGFGDAFSRDAAQAPGVNLVVVSHHFGSKGAMPGKIVESTIHGFRRNQN